MGIRAKFNMGDVHNYVSQRLQALENAMVFNLNHLGEQAVNHARSIPALTGFHDQTGNLRSSIGYVVLNNGKVSGRQFTQVLGGSEGIKQAESLTAQIAADYPKGYVLVVVAGMDYAVAVESRGKDVLTSSEVFARQKMPKVIATIKKLMKEENV